MSMRPWLVPVSCLALLASAASGGCGGGGGSGAASTGGRGIGTGGTGGNGSGGGGISTGGAPGSGGGSATGGSASGGSGASSSGGSTASGGIAGTGVGTGGRGAGASGGGSGSGTGGRGAGTGGASTGSGGAGGGTSAAGLSFNPPEGIYSVSLSVTTAGVTRTLALHNGRAAPVMITALTVSGADAARFIIEGAPSLPAPVAANGDLALTIRFLPNAAGPTSVYTASVRAVAAGGADMATAGLYGLAMNTANSEASLDQVVKTLGYAVNVGGTSLTLGTGSAAIGDEVLAPRFVRVGAAGVVGLQPVARYSPFESAAYGYYSGTNPAGVRHPLGTMSRGPADNVANRTLFPPLDAGAMLTFDPGSASFGIFAESQANTASLGADGRFYQEDALNNDQAGVLPVHRLRIYPLKNRAGQVVANSFLVVCEEASNSDYQDYVFVLTNVAISPN